MSSDSDTVDHLKKFFKLLIPPFIDFTSDGFADVPENDVNGVDVARSSDISWTKPEFEPSDVILSGGINMPGPEYKSDDVFEAAGI